MERNECRQVIRDAKSRSWENFLNGINSNQSATELWGRVNALSGKRKAQGMAINHNGALTRDPTIIAQALGEYFASLSAFDKYGSEFTRKNDASVDTLERMVIPEDTSYQPINEPFRAIELELALAKCKGKSAGNDEVGYPMLKHLTPSGKSTLLRLINKEWLDDTLPQEWNHSLIIPIPKQGTKATAPSDFTDMLHQQGDGKNGQP